jgi:16S rRNA (guanine966-N2)-methyltransferase
VTRIIAGRLARHRLAVPDAGTRPTSDMAREGLFSTLAALLGSLDGIRFLDLYAGSGAVGLEALSRGAGAVAFVEAAPRAVRTLRANVDAMAARAPDLPAPAVLHGSAESAAGRFPHGTLDVVFADAPYDTPPDDVAAVIAMLVPALAPDAVVVVERSSREPWRWPAGLTALRERRYGDATLWYGRREGP